MISEQPDLAILDLNVPAANEGDVFELLATDPELADTQVVILTGQKDLATIQSCENLQAHYIPKQGNVWRRVRSVITELLGTSKDHFSNQRSTSFTRRRIAPVVV